MSTARELTSRLHDLLRREQSALADFLLALADFDANRRWQELGYTSLFHFLHRELGMSKGAAHYRKTAAELVRRVPEVVEPLRDGRLCITSIIELAKVLTPENQDEVLPRFFHRSRQEAKEMSAELRPAEAAPHRTVMTALPMVVASGRAPVTAVQPVELAMTVPVAPVSPPPARMAPAMSSPTTRVPPRSAAEPLTADLRRLHVTVSKRFTEKLGAARDALSHSHPGADVEAILEAGLDLLIERAAKRKGIVERPRRSPSSGLSRAGAGTRSDAVDGEGSGSRHIPAAVRREVWIRDGGRCQFRLANGEICGSTRRLQFDHVHPFALGGESTARNLRLACAAHNLLAARRVFGDALMDRFAPPESSGSMLEPR
jgi:hypothetical protein